MLRLPLLVALSFAVARAQGDNIIPPHRKTISFTPRLRHASFNTTPWSPPLPLHDPHEIAFALAAHLHPRAEYHLRDDSYTDTLSGISHIYLQQYINGLAVLNGKLNANIKDGVVLSHGESLVPSTSPRTPVDARMAAIYFVMHATSRDELANSLASDFDAHIRRATILRQPITKASQWSHVVQNVPDTTEPVKARLALVQTPSHDLHDSHLHYAWELLVQMDQNTYEVAISITSPPMILSVIDRVSDFLQDASLQPVHGGFHRYRVFPWDVNDPDSGFQTMVTVDADRVASPRGWHFIPIDHAPRDLLATEGHDRMPNYTETTLGNNVFAQEWWERPEVPLLKRRRPISSTPWPSLTFDSPYTPTLHDNRSTEAQKHIEASITQLWYTANMVHDLFYHYGFDEIAGNFQQYNFVRGGKEYDAVIINAQDYGGYNGSTFENNPDGKNPICRIYLWGAESGTVPYKDGAFQEDIILHELTHGLSERLVGGPADVSCLSGPEAGGLSEGWSDFVALVVRVRETYRDLAIGVWASEKPAGIRNYPYSLNRTLNPTTYSYLDDTAYSASHRVGVVWANTLWGVLRRLIRTHGFSSTLFPPEYFPNNLYRVDLGVQPVPRHGNTLALRLVIDSMKLLPCNPTFLDARNALLQADYHLTGGNNTCDIWRGFAERGMGAKAHLRLGTTLTGQSDHRYIGLVLHHILPQVWPIVT
ncbi:hypothetical protein EXIGLDRAFT_823643 [Exidia glandulosa HHB12029]|uniref:Extracellular metalloproteinase n=1 Tax=Exidia glandulosa HHB12029 TaxID=1314781 RepID=A0A165J814_EXIGL|nr:hypothetical protein EXIGLDRAFT_823643 [Exidia glandulosa HHB12029]